MANAARPRQQVSQLIDGLSRVEILNWCLGVESRKRHSNPPTSTNIKPRSEPFPMDGTITASFLQRDVQGLLKVCGEGVFALGPSEGVQLLGRRELLCYTTCIHYHCIEHGHELTDRPSS